MRPITLGRFDQTVGFGERGGDWFFDQHVDAGFEQRAADFGVQHGGDGDDRGIHLSDDSRKSAAIACCIPGVFLRARWIGIDHVRRVRRGGFRSRHEHGFCRKNPRRLPRPGSCFLRAPEAPSPTMAIFAALAFASISSLSSSSVRPASTASAVVFGFNHCVDGAGPDHRHIEEQMPAARRRFHQRQSLPFDQAGGAAQHGVGAFHGFERHARAVRDRHALADIETRERVSDPCGRIRYRALVRIGFAFCR